MEWAWLSKEKLDEFLIIIYEVKNGILLIEKSREVTPIKKNIWQNVILVIFRISSGLCLKTRKM